MIRKLKQCFLLYLRDVRFVTLCAIGLISLCAMHALVYWGIQRNLWQESLLNVSVGKNHHFEILVQKYILGDELLSGVFIVGLWIMFTFGLLIKRQFANDRASLLPNYRIPHVITAVGILVVMIGLTICLSKSAMTLSQFFLIEVLNASVSLWAIYLVILSMALIMLYLGYLSMGYLVVVGYIFLAVLAQNIMPIFKILTESTLTLYSANIILVTMIILFIHRLLTLKNEHAEYAFILTWPPKKTIRNQLIFENNIHLIKTRCLKMIGLTQREHTIPPYYHHQGIWARANHWRYCDPSNIYSLLIFAIVGLPIYYIFLKSSLAEFLMITKIEYNFLLLAGSPVLLTVITNYKNMIFWGADLLKPVSRTKFLKEQGTKLFSDLIVYWVIIAVYFAILPDWTHGAQQLGENHFWAFLFLTFTFSLLSLSWLGILSALNNERAVLGNGLVLSLLFMFEFLGAGRTSTGWIMINAFLCLILGALFLKLAYQKWIDKEF